MATKPKISRGFKDFSLSFKKHPITNDIIAIFNEDAIKNSVVNLIRTRVGERFFQPQLGTSIEDSLFELTTTEISFTIENEINQVLRNYEPRILVTDINIDVRPEDNELEITISYNIIGIEPSSQTATVILNSTRA